MKVSFFHWVSGFSTAFILFLVLLAGFGIGRQAVVDDCHDFGKFRQGGKLYSCHYDSVVVPQP